MTPAEEIQQLRKKVSILEGANASQASILQGARHACTVAAGIIADVKATGTTDSRFPSGIRALKYPLARSASSTDSGRNNPGKGAKK